MPFSDLYAHIDARLGAERYLTDSQRSFEHDTGVWTLDRQAVVIRPAGSTGIEILYQTDGRVIHARTFAASPMSVPRIVRTVTEHLLGYRATQPQET